MDLTTTVLVDGLVFPEAPRWHAGKLWFSDAFANQVKTVDLQGHSTLVAEVPGSPSGLGWLPDGQLLVVSMFDRRLLRLDPTGFVEVADLSKLMAAMANDMVVDHGGRAYIGDVGFDMFAGQDYAQAEIVLVLPDGATHVVADTLDFPNGMIITPDERTLVVGETAGARLTAFDIGPDGSLSGRRTWAQIEGSSPDGICVDAAGAIWVASPGSAEVVRVREGGEITDRVRLQLPRKPFACMLGGPDRRTLCIMTAELETMNIEDIRARQSGRIEVVHVDVPGAGWP